jgi:hypothetical protein
MSLHLCNDFLKAEGDLNGQKALMALLLQVKFQRRVGVRVGGDSESHATAAAKAGRPLPASAGEDRRPGS